MDHESKEAVKTYLKEKKGFILLSHDRDFLDACIDHVLVLNRNSIEVGMMSIICKCKTPSFDEVLRAVLMDDLEESLYLAEFEKYDLLKHFWRMVGEVFGYTDENPTLEKLTLTLFVTYTSKVITEDVPVAWSPFVSFKSGTILTFLDNLMNNTQYSERFDQLSEKVYHTLKAESEFKKMPPEALVYCSIFAGVEKILIFLVG